MYFLLWLGSVTHSTGLGLEMVLILYLRAWFFIVKAKLHDFNVQILLFFPLKPFPLTQNVSLEVMKTCYCGAVETTELHTQIWEQCLPGL